MIFNKTKQKKKVEQKYCDLIFFLTKNKWQRKYCGLIFNKRNKFKKEIKIL